MKQEHGNTAFRKVSRMLHVEQTNVKALTLIHTLKVWMLRGQVSLPGSTVFERILKQQEVKTPLNVSHASLLQKISENV